jgi:hypothetical protein
MIRQAMLAVEYVRKFHYFETPSPNGPLGDTQSRLLGDTLGVLRVLKCRGVADSQEQTFRA